MSEDAQDISQIVSGLGQVAAFVRMAGWREAEPLGLTPTQTACLSLLAGRGASRVTVLARLLGVTQPTASEVVAALERKGLVERRRDPADGRAARIVLTAAGARIVRQTAQPPAALAHAIGGLEPGERAGLRRALAKTILSLQQQGAIEPQRLCLTCRFFRPYVHSDAEKPHHCAFVDAAFGDASLRLDCSDHEEAGPGEGASAPPAREPA
ncbi:MAG: MarR family winged helix-turn-helix transcriptional regulator [Aquamicrobium sp.]|uniref:MarR family winged helix-turn-helix transcriptional regulator n=1 Tax=Aquamicrobium sp. TaxID=1872579 RepID=UPI00349ED19F|nr:MarR family winged helix-turn-helix transcriptional regulator [Aquamicrobium sp.]